MTVQTPLKVFLESAPESPEAEMCLLGCMLMNFATVPEVAGVLSGVSDFKSQTHQTIYAAMGVLYARDHRLDLVTLNEYLRDRGTLDQCGGAAYLQELAYAVPSGTAWPVYSRIVANRARLRRLALAADEVGHLARHAKHEDADVESARALDLIEKAGRSGTASTAVTLSAAANLAIASLERREASYALSGVVPVDVLGGLPVAGVVTVMAYPGVGKTTLMLASTLGLCRVSGFAATVFSYEQSPMRIAATMISTDAEVQFHNLLNTGSLPTDTEWPRIRKATAEYVPVDLSIQPDNLTADRIFNVVRTLPRGRRVVLVDYLQRLPPPTGMDAGNESTCRAESMRWLSRAALDLGVLMIVVSQPNKEAGKTNRRLTAADGKGAQEIEAFSDVIMCLHRPHMHETRPPDDGTAAFGAVEMWKDRQCETEIYLVKNKFGSCGGVDARFDPRTMRFNLKETH